MEQNNNISIQVIKDDINEKELLQWKELYYEHKNRKENAISEYDRKNKISNWALAFIFGLFTTIEFIMIFISFSAKESIVTLNNVIFVLLINLLIDCVAYYIQNRWAKELHAKLNDEWDFKYNWEELARLKNMLKSQKNITIDVSHQIVIIEYEDDDHVIKTQRFTTIPVYTTTDVERATLYISLEDHEHFAWIKIPYYS